MTLRNVSQMNSTKLEKEPEREITLKFKKHPNKFSESHKID